MAMPGRKYEQNAGFSYRYSINTQEKEKEINENITTALFWEYDSRVARRWNMDPIPNVLFSPYSCFGLNPVFHSDVYGDIFKTGTDQQSKDDINNLANGSNRGYIKIDENTGNVTLDFGGKSQADINNILANDGGLKLISDLVNGKKSFYYGAETHAVIINKGADNRAYLRFTGSTINSGDGSRSPIANLSKYGFNSTDRIDEVPAFYDGLVIVDPTATFTEFDGAGNIVPLNRVNIVFHELAENYERTENNIDYKDKRANRNSGAHDRANKRETNSNFHLVSTNPGSPQSQTATFLTPAQQRDIYSKMKWILLKANYVNGSLFDSEVPEYINYFKNCKRPSEN